MAIALHASMREVLDDLPDGVVIVNESGRIVYANRQVEILTGYRRSELEGRPVELLVPASLRTLHVKQRRRYAARPSVRPMGSPDHDFQLRRRDGTELPVDIALGPIGTRLTRLTAAVIRDIGDRRRLEADLEHRALHDPLTDLPNRSLFFDRLEQAMMGFRRDRRPVAIVMLDLDRFKSVNDAYGHVAGDALLRQLSARLQSRLRATDTVARIGGDEFAWILPHVAGPQAAFRKARALLQAMPRRYSFDGNQVEIGISAGMALFPDDAGDVDTLMRQADLALYTAKRQGGGLALVGRQSRGTTSGSAGKRRRRP
jgi:diguanylate cyclase